MRQTKTVTVGGREITLGEPTLAGLMALMDRKDGPEPEAEPEPGVYRLMDERVRGVWALCALDCSWEEFRELARTGAVYASEVRELWAALEEVVAPFEAVRPGGVDFVRALGGVIELFVWPPSADWSAPDTPERQATD